MVRRGPPQHRPSRDAHEAITECKQTEERRQDQYLIHINIVVSDRKEDLDEVNAALDLIRGVGSADCYKAQLLEPTDSRRVEAS